ncbi:MAG TPA: trigger factor [Mycobacteriales bacterium]|nr:trigger factor [Mycobacteriales bacterium]
MKSAVETLGPTRVKLTVEVPFDELEPALTAAYRKIGQQVRIKGFRPGKVPARLIDQHVGRGAVLEEAVNESLPTFYGNAVREQELEILGHPEIEVTNFADGEQLAFTAEVDVRPEIELPEYDGLPVSVEDADVDEADVEQQLEALRDRFATLAGVERAVASGDFVSIDLTATVDGAPVEDASASNLSYEVGSDALVSGLDEALIGLSVGESKEFETQLRSGDEGGQAATATVTVRSVKEKQVPDLDDDFAQTASEFDTIEELRSDVRDRFARIKALNQGVQAREKVLEALLDKIEVPVPEHVLHDEVHYRRDELDSQLKAAGITKDDYAAAEGTTAEAIDAELEDNAAKAIRSQFILDAIAKKEELSVDESDLTEEIVRRAARSGMRADAFAQQIVNAGALGSLMSDILRGKALAGVMERAKITDASGRPVDLEKLSGRADSPAAADQSDEADEADQPAEADQPDEAAAAEQADQVAD